jgi:hypothetical protein
MRMSYRKSNTTEKFTASRGTSLSFRLKMKLIYSRTLTNWNGSRRI